VGNNGVIYHYDGISWNSMSSGTNQRIEHVWGSCDGNAFAVGFSGTILHYAFAPCFIQNGSVSTVQGQAIFSINAGSLSRLRALAPEAFPCGEAGYFFPFGMFAFNITDLTAGQSVRITITLPAQLSLDAKYYKCQNGMIVDCSSLVSRPNLNTLILTIRDGGLGDSDGRANGTIVDPGGPAMAIITGPTSHGGYMPSGNSGHGHSGRRQHRQCQRHNAPDRLCQRAGGLQSGRDDGERGHVPGHL
jgi:hypothetical protein